MSKIDFLKKLANHKNFVFIILCLIVHLCNSILFCCFKLYPLMFLNILSSLIYLCLLALWNTESDTEMILTYYEIIIFSIISDLLTNGQFNYIFFVFGIISVIYYLLSEHIKHKHLIQVSGILLFCVQFYFKYSNVCIFPEYAKLAQPYANLFTIMNMSVAFFTLIYVSELYLIDLKLTKEKLTYNANHDLLTGLYCRRFFQQTCSKRHKEFNETYSIAMMDLDNFKKINDTYGHDTGDKILCVFSDCLKRNIKENSLAVRWGGEEFIIYMPNTKLEEAVEIVKIIQKDLSLQYVESDSQKIQITVTVGIQDSDDIGQYEEVINQADNKLYKGKQNGKNCIVYQ